MPSTPANWACLPAAAAPIRAGGGQLGRSAHADTPTNVRGLDVMGGRNRTSQEGRARHVTSDARRRP